MRLKAIAATAALLATAVLGAGSAFAQGRPPLAPLLLETKAFEDGGIVPQKYAGRGGVQPGFTISNAPDTTQTFAIIFHDIDVAIGGADDVLHWMAWNIPNVKEIPEGKLPDGSVTGKNITGQPHTWAPAHLRDRAITTTCSRCMRSARSSTCPTRRRARICSRQ